MAVLRVFFFLRRKAAEEKKGLGRIAERMLCSCKLRLRRGKPECRKVKRKTLDFLGFLDFALGMKRLPCHRLG